MHIYVYMYREHRFTYKTESLAAYLKHDTVNQLEFNFKR